MVDEQQPKLRIRRQGKVNVVELEDRKILEELLIAQLGEQLGSLVDAEAEPRLVLDFKKVEHLSSAALGILITLDKQVKGRRGKLALANIQPQIYEVFKITRLNKLFSIQDTADAAVQALA
ncbi:MAG: STAS domain-containing protein [Planctomycetes bacterium]|nr:STAS domain-containing protein [Planctomycetota bacterium]